MNWLKKWRLRHFWMALILFASVIFPHDRLLGITAIVLASAAFNDFLAHLRSSLAEKEAP